MICKVDKTLTFDEEVKGWTSFHSFSPDLMIGMNNRFFSFINGQLHEHHSDNVNRNNFFGEQSSSRITTIFNDSPQDDKIFKTMVLEGTDTWELEASTNYTNAKLSHEEYKAKESRYFAYLRNTENEDDISALNAIGIGVIQDTDYNSVVFTKVPSVLSIGDQVYQLVNDQPQLIGIVNYISGNTLDFDPFENTPIEGAFCFSKKTARIEGSEIRGYYLEATFTNSSTEKTELFAVNTNAVKSFV